MIGWPACRLPAHTMPVHALPMIFIFYFFWVGVALDRGLKGGAGIFPLDTLIILVSLVCLSKLPTPALCAMDWYDPVSICECWTILKPINGQFVKMWSQIKTLNNETLLTYSRRMWRLLVLQLDSPAFCLKRFYLAWQASSCWLILIWLYQARTIGVKEWKINVE